LTARARFDSTACVPSHAAINKIAAPSEASRRFTGRILSRRPPKVNKYRSSLLYRRPFPEYEDEDEDGPERRGYGAAISFCASGTI